jgi:hypothetical protein
MLQSRFGIASHCLRSTLPPSILAVSLAIAPAVSAQDEPVDEAPPAGEIAPAEPEPPSPPPETPPVVTTAPEPPPPALPPDPEIQPEAAVERKFTVGAGLRTGLNATLSGYPDPVLTLDDGLVDQVNVRPFMSGELTPELGYFVQFEIGTPNGLGNFAILDAIAQIKFIDELQLWVGQHIGANYRNNTNGPFFGNTWNFAISVPSYPFDVGARDRGFTFWGLIAGGHIKYHASVLDLQRDQRMENARFGGRLTIHLLEPENFYYNSGTYWGKQDVLALGAVINYQKGVSPPDPEGTEDNDFLGYSFDLLFEKNFGAAGTFTLEGGYWNFEEVGPGYVVNQGTVDTGIGIVGPFPGTAWMGVISWLTPEKIGICYIQPNARIQYGNYDPVTLTTLDVGLAYVIDGFNHKYHINYRRHRVDPFDAGSTTYDMIQLGAQFIMSN